jgi:DNA polymerase-3 subunit alpha
MNVPASPSGFVPHSPRFIHLRLHTEYSITDGIARIGATLDAAAENGMPALGISDLGNLFGMVKFSRLRVNGA